MGFEGHTRGMWNYGFLPLSSLARGTDILVSGFGRSYPTWIDLPKLSGHTQGMWNYGFLPLSSLARGTDILVWGFGRSYPTWIDLPKLSGCPCPGSGS